MEGLQGEQDVRGHLKKLTILVNVVKMNGRGTEVRQLEDLIFWFVVGRVVKIPTLPI